MRLSEILFETYVPPGSWKNPNVRDLRDPNVSVSKSSRIVLTKTGGAIIYNYGNGNVLSWSDLLRTIDDQNDSSLGFDKLFGLKLRAESLEIDSSKETGSWTGDRTVYSPEVREAIRRLLALGLIKPSTVIRLNSGLAGSEVIGRAGAIAKAPETPKRLVLYHGTSSFRLPIIMQGGLRPLGFATRVWNNTSLDKERPEHREDSVYLTASPPQALYYAKKAVNVDRRRYGWRAWRNALVRKRNIEWEIERKEAWLKHETGDASRKSTEKSLIALRKEHADTQAILDLIEKNGGSASEVKPVLLKVTLTPREYKRLMADDDYLRLQQKRGKDADPNAAFDSIGSFGQVAYRGVIPPGRIEVVNKSDILKPYEPDN